MAFFGCLARLGAKNILKISEMLDCRLFQVGKNDKLIEC